MIRLEETKVCLVFEEELLRCLPNTIGNFSQVSLITSCALYNLN
jgi:hypothetical protein